MLALIRRHPGISMGELKRRLAVGWGTVYHHLAMLSAGRFVESRRVGHRRIFFVAGTGGADLRATARAVLRGETVRSVAYFICRNPSCSVGEIIRGTRLAPRVAYYHLKNLLDQGLVESSSRTRHVGIRARPELQLAIDEALSPED
jgi:predicted transcriptional regulator